MNDIKTFTTLEKDDKILFNSRKTPLTVEEVKENEKIVSGPKGGEYILYLTEEDDLLVSRKDNKRYSSYVEDLRKTGEWIKKDEKTWSHSKTNLEAKICSKPTGYYYILIDGKEDVIEQPKYGFNDLEVAKEELKSFIDNNPEGKI